MKKRGLVITPQCIEEETTMKEELFAYEDVITQIRNHCEEKIDTMLASNNKKIVGHRYEPYNFPVFHIHPLQLFTPKWMLPMLLYCSFSFCVIYLLFNTCDIVIAACSAAIILTIVVYPIGYLCNYPFRPKSQVYTLSYHVRNPSTQLCHLLPTHDDIKEMHERAMAKCIEELSIAITRQCIMRVENEIHVDISIPAVDSYIDFHVKDELNSVDVL